MIRFTHPWGPGLMKKTFAMILCILVPMAIFGADNGYKVAYDGGSVADVKTGTDLKLSLAPKTFGW
jgi:hypothetical protein